MPSVIAAAIQSAVLKAAANLTAQVAASYKTRGPKPLDWQSVVEFAIFGLIQAQINLLWQQFLEDSFPTRKHGSSVSKPDQEARINWLHIFIKLILDQTLGQFIMNTTFLVCTNIARVDSSSQVVDVVRGKVWRIIQTGWRIWPAVSLCNFIWVPVEYRVVVASCVGFGWNIFLTLISLTK